MDAVGADLEPRAAAALAAAARHIATSSPAPVTNVVRTAASAVAAVRAGGTGNAPVVRPATGVSLSSSNFLATAALAVAVGRDEAADVLPRPGSLMIGLEAASTGGPEASTVSRPHPSAEARAAAAAAAAISLAGAVGRRAAVTAACAVERAARQAAADGTQGRTGRGASGGGASGRDRSAHARPEVRGGGLEVSLHNALDAQRELD